MSNKTAVLIRPEGPPDLHLYSKYRLEGRWENRETGILEIWTLNVNTDIPIPRFNSKGANNSPPESNLTATYENNNQFIGFDRFSGSIGGGRFYLRTDKGVVVKGEIEGGPEEGQSFVGSGSWIKS